MKLLASFTKLEILDSAHHLMSKKGGPNSKTQIQKISLSSPPFRLRRGSKERPKKSLTEKTITGSGSRSKSDNGSVTASAMVLDPKPVRASEPPPSLPAFKNRRRLLSRGRRLVRASKIPAAADGIHRHSRGVRKGRTEKSQARASEGAGGGAADSICAFGHWSIHEQRHSRVHYRVELLRPDPEHHQP